MRWVQSNGMWHQVEDETAMPGTEAKITYVKQTILQEADAITSGDRQKAYGHPSNNHGCTAEMQQAYLERREAACQAKGEMFLLDARDVCMLNIIQKISRDANMRQRDNLIDIVGYARNMEMIEEYDANQTDA
jgi:hypothetical protein